jgi:hypothetical protein
MAAVKKKPNMSCASSGHIAKLKQSIFAPFDIYGLRQKILFFLNGVSKANAVK